MLTILADLQHHSHNATASTTQPIAPTCRLALYTFKVPHHLTKLRRVILFNTRSFLPRTSVQRLQLAAFALRISSLFVFAITPNVKGIIERFNAAARMNNIRELFGSTGVADSRVAIPGSVTSWSDLFTKIVYTLPLTC